MDYFLNGEICHGPRGDEDEPGFIDRSAAFVPPRRLSDLVQRCQPGQVLLGWPGYRCSKMSNLNYHPYEQGSHRQLTRWWHSEAMIPDQVNLGNLVWVTKERSPVSQTGNAVPVTSGRQAPVGAASEKPCCHCLRNGCNPFCNHWLQNGLSPKRRGGDSNPRSRFQDTAFPVLHNRPLCHLSELLLPQWLPSISASDEHKCLTLGSL